LPPQILQVSGAGIIYRVFQGIVTETTITQALPEEGGSINNACTGYFQTT